MIMYVIVAVDSFLIRIESEEQDPKGDIMRIARFDREKGGITVKSNVMVEDIGLIMMNRSSVGPSLFFLTHFCIT